MLYVLEVVLKFAARFIRRKSVRHLCPSSNAWTYMMTVLWERFLLEQLREEIKSPGPCSGLP